MDFQNNLMKVRSYNLVFSDPGYQFEIGKEFIN